MSISSQGNVQLIPLKVSNDIGSVSDSQLETFLGLDAGSLDNVGNGNATEGSAVKIGPIDLSAGESVKVDFNFTSNESTNSWFPDPWPVFPDPGFPTVSWADPGFSNPPLSTPSTDMRSAATASNATAGILPAPTDLLFPVPTATTYNDFAFISFNSTSGGQDYVFELADVATTGAGSVSIEVGAFGGINPGQYEISLGVVDVADGIVIPILKSNLRLSCEI